MARVHGQRGHHREDQPVEHLVEVGLVAAVEGVPVAQLDPLGRQGGRQVVEQERLLAADHPLERAADVRQQLVRACAVEGPALDAGHHLAPQAGHLDLEELVDPLAEEDEELDPLEQGELGVGHQVEQAVVEVEVGELAGEVPLVGVRAGAGRRTRGRCRRSSANDSNHRPRFRRVPPVDRRTTGRSPPAGRSPRAGRGAGRLGHNGILRSMVDERRTT